MKIPWKGSLLEIKRLVVSESDLSTPDFYRLMMSALCQGVSVVTTPITPKNGDVWVGVAPLSLTDCDLIIIGQLSEVNQLQRIIMGGDYEAEKFVI